MILTKLSILISLILFIFVEPSQKRKIFDFICSRLHLLRISELALLVRDKFTNVVRRFIYLFQTHGLRLKRLGGQWSKNYDYDFWFDLKEGDLSD